MHQVPQPSCAAESPDAAMLDDSSDLHCYFFLVSDFSSLHPLIVGEVHGFITKYSKDQALERNQKEPVSEVCHLLVLVKAQACTSGWYLQSADSQLLVCFNMQVKPKSRCPGWGASPLCLQMTALVFFISEASIHLCQSSSRRQISSVKVLPELPSANCKIIRSDTGITWWQT